MLELPYWLGCSRNAAMGTTYFPSHPEGICSTHTDYWCHESDPPGSCELPDVVGPSIRSIGVPTTILEPVCPGQEMSGGADGGAEHLLEGRPEEAMPKLEWLVPWSEPFPGEVPPRLMFSKIVTLYSSPFVCFLSPQQLVKFISYCSSAFCQDHTFYFFLKEQPFWQPDPSRKPFLVFLFKFFLL